MFSSTSAKTSELLSVCGVTYFYQRVTDYVLSSHIKVKEQIVHINFLPLLYNCFDGFLKVEFPLI